MPFVSKKAKLKLTEDELKKLTETAKARSGIKSRVERAKILLFFYSGKNISEIARQMNTNRPKIERCVNKALNFGIETALEDLPRKGKPQTIDMNARTWFLSLACIKPKELGFASEYWTTSALAKYARENCEAAGYSCLKALSKGAVSKILNKSDVRPHKTSYYLERRDPDFDRKMAHVLHVYKEVEMYRGKDGKENIAILSYDEKPGIQAIGNLAPDLPPSPGKYSTWAKDYEYKRYGTVSLLASIDLLNGKIHSKVFDRHRSREFIDFLKSLDEVYSEDTVIKIVLDNHSSHISKETMKYLNSVPNRFKFVFTPKHASWLNMIEMFFSKMARSFLRGIRVASKDEIKSRILKYIDELNQSPVIFKWKWKMNEVKI
jgi:transposase